MMIVFDQVTKKYGNGTVALEDVSFEVEPGEFVVIEGRSGAGKTTLQKLMLKETACDSGTIHLDGDDISKISARNLPLLRRKVGVVFQDFKLLSDKTVAENILIALDIIGISGEVAEQRLVELLKLTGLTNMRELFPSQLSGGELQRVAIARALAPEPKVLFADEPTGNLDDKTASSIIELLQTINNQGTTTLVATHDHHFLKNQNRRTLYFELGKLVKDSKKKDQSLCPK